VPLQDLNKDSVIYMVEARRSGAAHQESTNLIEENNPREHLEVTKALWTILSPSIGVAALQTP
jgi:hypothetical protein